MLQQLRLSLASLAVVVAGYVAYEFLVVPRLDPPLIGQERTPQQSVGPTATVGDRHESQLSELFPAGAWERDRPKLVETDRGILLFKDYRPLEDGRMELAPCSMIFFRATRGSSGSDVRRAIVMLVPEGAILQFAGDADTTRGHFGRLVGGSLRGEVRIHAPESYPGANDQIDASTHGVKIDEQRIWTPQRVEFQFGLNRGNGSDLTIGFAARVRSKSGTPLAASIGGLASLRLEHLENLQLDTNRLHDSTREPASGSQTSLPKSLFPLDSAPLDIKCEGPFEFSFEDGEATFSDRVIVERAVDATIRDQLRCDVLTIEFQRSAVVIDGATPPNDDTPAKGPLEPTRIIAKGSPVVLQVPSIGASSRAEYMEYDMRTRELRVRDSRRAHLRHMEIDVDTPEVRYQFPEDARRLGVAWLAGPGQLTATTSRPVPRTVTLNWAKELRLRPTDDAHLISLTGDVQWEAPGFRLVHANEVHGWIDEFVAESLVDPTVEEVRWELDRLLAAGDVRFDSRRVEGRIERLEAWIQQSSARASKSTTGPAFGRPPRLAPPSFPRNGTAESDDANAVSDGGRFLVEGGILRLQMVQAGNEWSLDDLAVEKRVRLRQASPTYPDAFDLDLKGETCEALNLLDGHGELTIQGDPATVTIKSVRTTAKAVHIDQASNRLTIESEGQMAFYREIDNRATGQILYQNPDLQTSPIDQPPEMVVSWDQGMDFDGLRAKFSQDVQVRGRNESQVGEVFDWLAMGSGLEVVLKSKLPFVAADNQPSAEVERVAFVGNVFIEGKTTAGNQTLSIDQAQIKNLVLSQFKDQQPQRMHGDGPGWLNTVRYDAELAAGPNASTDPQAASVPRLVNLHIDFERAVDGGGGVRELTFSDQVLALFGPVQGWNEELDPRDLQQLGSSGAVVRCRQLTVADLGDSSRSQHAIELRATGNAEASNAEYRARGERISYVRNKDLLILEGDARRQAEIWTKGRGDDTLPDFIAGKIVCRPRNGEISVDGIRRFEWRNPKNPGQVMRPGLQRK